MKTAPRAETECQALPNRPPEALRPAPPYPARPPASGSARTPGRCRASSQTRTPAHDIGDSGFCAVCSGVNRASRDNKPILNTPRKLSPIRMMTTPAILAKHILPLAQELTDAGRARTEQNEHGRKAKNKCQRGPQSMRADSLCRLSPHRQTGRNSRPPCSTDKAAPAAARRATETRSAPAPNALR